MSEPTTTITDIVVKLEGRSAHVGIEGTLGYRVHMSLPVIDDRLYVLEERDQPALFSHVYATQDEAVDAAKKLLAIVNANTSALYALQEKLAENLKELWPESDK